MAASQPYVTEERLERGLVIVLTGIEGRSVFNEEICRGLDEGGVDGAIELYDWTASPLLPLYNLRAEARNRRKAGEIAQHIVLYQWDHPGRPVVLVGQSGGGAMTAWIVEALPTGAKVDGIVMLAPTLSPAYMLDIALKRSERGIVNFHSPWDWLFLRAGTTIYGTMDGYHTSSAGSVGYEVPTSGPRKGVYAKLLQVPWNAKMASAGHTGAHLTSGSASFVKKYVAPFVRRSDWGQPLVDHVVQGEEVSAPPPEKIEKPDPAVQSPPRPLPPPKRQPGKRLPSEYPR